LRIGADFVDGSGRQAYGTYTVSTDRTDGERGVVTVGQRSQISNQLRVFNEVQLSHAEREAGLAKVFGVDIAPRERWKIGFSLQSSDLDSVTTDAIERDAASVSVAYADERLRFGGKIERRTDGGSVDKTQWLATNSVDPPRAASSRAASGSPIGRFETTG
jgi:hypothetical protein